MQTKNVIKHISEWLSQYSEASRTKGYVVGVSGGIDSAVTSTLCALSGKELVVVEMPIHQAVSHVTRAREHMKWLVDNFPNVRIETIELTDVFDRFMQAVPLYDVSEGQRNLAQANSRARLRMTALYYIAGVKGLLVGGTGNKVEDFGVGFFTKYGDGGVDVSPIADLTKTEVYLIAAELGVAQSIQDAAPTDGLWGDDRTDEDQIGASYPELEWAMSFLDNFSKVNGDFHPELPTIKALSERQQTILSIYWRMNRANQHKMKPIPVCIIPETFRL